MTTDDPTPPGRVTAGDASAGDESGGGAFGGGASGGGGSSAAWQQWRAEVDLDGYDERWRRLQEAGVDPHGEAAFVMRYVPRSVLDGGCGTGRVGIELARRGVEVVGVDLDADMVDAARRKAPQLDWHVANLAEMELPHVFDVVVLAGNVVPFVAPDARAAAIARCARHLRPGGRLITGFSLRDGWPSAADLDGWCAAAGLQLEGRWATWDGDEAAPGDDYAVSVHVAAAPAAPAGHAEGM